MIFKNDVTGNLFQVTFLRDGVVGSRGRSSAALNHMKGRSRMTKYPVTVWNTDGVYIAEVPDLSGVITEADSIGTLETFVKEAATSRLVAGGIGG